ncbi:MAG: divalent metal cation transporter [Planctomycetes bacterium]|nr:divalent metal cation transporter [Planctomycetota bacterium]
MAETIDPLARDRELLAAAEATGGWKKYRTFMRLSGPGWLQSAITLGGGSLAGSLYLGVLGGMTMLWLQPLAMILGIIMLSAIGYVTLSTGERPFRAINKHVNPVLGWSWAVATLMANIVWCMPQFSLASAVLQQNLLPEQLGAGSPLGEFGGKLVISITILVITVAITWSYGSGHWGIKLYEIVLKLMVASIVLCFVAVVVAMGRAGQVEWGSIFVGFIPNPGQIFSPADAFMPYLEQLTGEARTFWSSEIVSRQIDTIATAAATAVGINMTFLFPYSLLRKGWGKEFRGLAMFDLATGMFIPFVLATSCIVIASASQFHAQPVPGLVEPSQDEAGQPTAKEQKEYNGLLSKRLGVDPAMTAEQLPVVERQIAAMLVTRDANRLSGALTPLTGSTVGNVIFGFGVVGMALSTITILMLISGFVLCEMLNLTPTGWPFRLCCLAAALGVLGPFFWTQAAFKLAVPTSVFGLILLPIAYLTFFLLMNQRDLLGDELPQGKSRVVWNLLMFVAASIATVASLYMVWLKAHEKGLIAIGILLGAALIVQFTRQRHTQAAENPS